MIVIRVTCKASIWLVLLILAFETSATAAGWPECRGANSTEGVKNAQTALFEGKFGSYSMLERDGQDLRIQRADGKSMPMNKAGQNIKLEGLDGGESVISKSVGHGVRDRYKLGSSSSRHDTPETWKFETLTAFKTTKLAPYQFIGLDPEAKSFTSLVNHALPASSSSAQADWQETLNALNTMPSEQAHRVLQAARLTSTFTNPADLEGSELLQRVALAKQISETVELAKSLPPEAGRVWLDPFLTAKTDAEIQAWTNHSSAAIMRARFNEAKAAAESLGFFVNDRRTVQMVGGGQEGPVGSLAGVPPGVSVRINQAGHCWRKTTDSDRLLDLKTLMVGRSWDPSVFQDVGLMLKRAPGSGTGNIAVCSFVRISKTSVITAAHCAARKIGDQPWKEIEFGGEDVEALLLLPNLNMETKEPSQCFDNPASCGFYVKKLAGVASFPHGVQWNGTTPTPDIAILKASFDDAPKPSTQLVGNIKDPELTLAGYGLTNMGGQVYSGYLQVGWNRMPSELEGAVLVWDVLPQSGRAGGCVGDSGGAVFEGSIGVPKDPRRLAGLVSFGTGPSSLAGIDGCMAAVTGTSTRLGKHLPWICETSKNQALGCIKH